MAGRDTNTIAASLSILVILLSLAPATVRAGEPEHRIVSMLDLLTRPAEFEGKIVAVQGYLPEGMRLYLTKDHAAIADSPSSIAVEALPQLMGCIDAYVHVSGLFGLRNDEYGIVKVLEVSRWADPGSRSMNKPWLSTCWKRPDEE